MTGYEEFCEGFDDYDDRFSRVATEAEAHVEWHLNAGVPMGTPGCPQDACHGDYGPDYEPDEAEPPVWDEAAARVPKYVPAPESYDDDDIPF